MRSKQRLIVFLALVFLLAACRSESPAPAGAPTGAPARPIADNAAESATPTAVPTSVPLPAFTPVPLEHWVDLDIEELHEQIFAALMRRDLETATDLGLSELYGIPNDQLNDASAAYESETFRLLAEYVAILQGVDTGRLTPEQKLSHDVLLWDLEDQLAREPFRYHNYPVNQLFGVQNNLPAFMADRHPLQSKQDAQDSISRLSQFGTRFEQEIAGLEQRAEMGILPPRFVFDRVLTEMRNFINTPAKENIIYISFVERLQDVEELSDPAREELSAAVELEINQSVYPAYERLIETMEALRADATTDDGVWKLPDGEVYYAHTLRHHTTTEMTAAEIHELGLREVERIQGEMQVLLADSGYSTDPAIGIGQVYRNGGGLSITNEATRAQAYAAYEQALIKADEQLGHLFNLRPEAPLEIVRVPAFREATAPGAYYSPPPLDGSRPGVFYLNVPDGRFLSFVGVPTLAFHEAIPGHHFQLAIQRELTDVPTFRRANTQTAYNEGWALYVEKLAWEYGLYDDDPFGNWGRLQSELFRAVRLVVDTGIHDQGWTRQEAIDYMSEILGWSDEFVVPEVERYIVWPGQAAAYKIGELTILRLRSEAQEALGDQFDIAEFHTVILKNGSVPLSILEQIVHDWIDSQR